MSARPPTRVRIRKTLTGRATRAFGAAVLLIALAAVSLAHPTPAWASVFVSAAAILPLAMLVVGRYGNAASRPARYGFALCCGGYFLFFTYFAETAFLESLATTKSLEWWHGQLFPESNSPPSPPGRPFANGGAFDVANEKNATTTNQPPANKPPDADPFADTTPSAIAPYSISTTTVVSQAENDYTVAQNFWVIGQSVWALIFGCVGSELAAFLTRRQAKHDDNSAESVAALGPTVTSTSG